MNRDYSDPWRYRCPNGHASLRFASRSNNIRCRRCQTVYEEREIIDYKNREKPA